MKKKHLLNHIKTHRKAHFLLAMILVSLLMLMVGTVFNGVVIMENNCKMPVKGYIIESDTHYSFEDKNEVEHFYFADILEIKFLDYIIYYSIGDVLLFTSLIALIFFGIFYAITNLKLVREYKKIK